MILDFIRWMITADKGQKGWFLQLTPRQANKLKVFSKYLINVSPNFGYQRWAGHYKLFTRPEYKKLLDTFLKFGWIQWDRPESHRAGVSWTNDGIQAFYQLAGYTLSPPLLKSYDVGGLKGFEHTYIERT